MRCPCCSGKEYSQCCKPYHMGADLPPTALALMRSRYAAYALDLPEYLMETTHRDNPNFRIDRRAWKREIQKFIKGTKFLKLEIISFDETQVTFAAFLKQNAQELILKEKSLFQKQAGKWLYLSGELAQ
jgi:SEC-C motif domain protein